MRDNYKQCADGPSMQSLGSSHTLAAGHHFHVSTTTPVCAVFCAENTGVFISESNHSPFCDSLSLLDLCVLRSISFASPLRPHPFCLCSFWFFTFVPFIHPVSLVFWIRCYKAILVVSGSLFEIAASSLFPRFQFDSSKGSCTLTLLT